MPYYNFLNRGKKSLKIGSKLPKEKTLGTLKKELQVIFNRFIRLRDTINGTYFVCISCDEQKNLDQMNAGHYFAAGHNEAIRYDEKNCNGQCIRCNNFLHGNLIGYTKGMLKKYGQATIDDLEIRRHNISKLAKFEVRLLMDIYEKKIEALKKGK